MLSIVPTPIGNLKDITLRALDVLREADVIVCEDTRQTQKLLNAYEIKKPLLSFHEHSSDAKAEKILERAAAGEKVALVSDGGMPVLNDPGFEIIHAAIRKNIPYEVLPGASSVTTALVASGLAPDSFSFFGFLPVKSAGRRKKLAELADREETLIFFESPYRITQALEDMLAVLGDREAAVARELTKKFEEIQRGTLSELNKKLASKKMLGEFVLLVSGKDRKKLWP